MYYDLAQVDYEMTSSICEKHRRNPCRNCDYMAVKHMAVRSQ